MAAPGRISVLHLAAAESMIFPILRDQLCYLRELGYDVHTACIDGPLGRRIRDDDGFPWTPLPLTRRKLAPLADWRALRFIENLCRQQRFTVVHTHTPKGNVIGQWAARRAGVPVVLQTLHGFYFHEGMSSFERRVWMGIEHFSALHSDHVLCQNPEDVETAIRHGIIEANRITLLGNGIDLARFSPGRRAAARARLRAELSIPTDALVVGMVGRFVAEKGFPEFLAAGERLAEEAPNLHLLVVGHTLVSERSGETWRPPEASTLASRMTVLSNRDDMPDLYACMDVHVLPSHREGFPRALMEGAACGLPQVCTNIRGCRQTVEEGRTGYLVPVGSPALLAERVLRLLRDPCLRESMGAAARAKAESEFDQRLVFRRVDACYQRLLAERNLAGVLQPSAPEYH